MNFDDSQINKNTVQAVFYQVLAKKDPTKHGKSRAVRKGFFSAETLIFEIHILISAATLVLAACLFTPTLLLPIVLPIIYIVAFNFLFFKAYFKVFRVCRTNLDDDFNYAFGKAWFLHFYPTIETE